MTHINEEDVLRDYIAGMPVADIAVDNDCSKASVSRIAKKYNALRKNNNTFALKLNHAYFDVIDSPEKAQLLKLMMRAASISTANGKNIISVYASYTELDRLRKAIGAEHKKIYGDLPPEDVDTGNNHFQFQFSSKHMIETLLGVNPSSVRSLTDPPRILA